ncbi:histamine H1 receptor-like [Gigantopelta aegis]|uniref:histamine H1 receptor-like n=1 Tax=Gigantopelta aegis TaxID=1735272 RepID=UPI001B88D917|nr:histamine H1 receptor-like [Gigantopelta aegis]
MEQTTDNVLSQLFDYPFDDFWILNITMNGTNSSDVVEEVVVDDLWRVIPLGIVLSLLCVLTTVGNAMVLHAVRTEKRLQTVSNTFIVSLAIADLIVGLTVMPVSTIYIFTVDWLFGVAVCQIWIGIDYIASTASILNLFILSLDRYWSVKSPLLYLRKRTKKRALVMISLVWSASLLWIVPIVGWHHLVHGGVRTVPENECDTEYAQNSALKIITAFFNFYLPLAVMYTLYFKIFSEIRKRSEFELGQRISGRHYATAYIPGVPNSNSGEESEQPEDTVSEEPTHSVISNHSISQLARNTLHNSVHRNRGAEDYCMKNFNRSSTISYTRSRTLENHTPTTPTTGNCVAQGANHHGRSVFVKQKDGYKNLRLIAVKRQMSTRESKTPSSNRVEYVYDESVIDPQTERIERYFYEERLPLRGPDSLPVISNNYVRSDTSFSEHSSSTTSTFEDKPVDYIERPPSSSTGGSSSENYSVISGIRKIRQAEILLDKTVSMAEGRANQEKNMFVLRDDKNRRLTGMLNIKDRIKHFRQSSSLTKEIKAARQLGVIMGAFTLCFLPYFILFMVVAFCDNCVDPGVLTAATWVGYLNSTLNPFLYPLCNTNFRRKFRKMLGYRSTKSRKNFNGFDRNSITNARYD